MLVDLRNLAEMMEPAVASVDSFDGAVTRVLFNGIGAVA